MLTFREVAEGLGSSLLEIKGPKENGMVLQQVVIDSREASPGDLFVALQGERVDGHDFIHDALARGAKGVICQRLPQAIVQELYHDRVFFLVANSLAALQILASWWRAKLPIETIGITGSVGKTTTKEVAAAVLSQEFKVMKSPGNLNTEIGLPLTLLSLDGTHQRAVLEMGMYTPGDIALLCRIAQPKVGVITNIGPSHLERTGSLERTAQAKRELVESLPKDGVAVLNGDDPLVASMAQAAPGEVVRYGCSPNCQVRATQVESLGLGGIKFCLHWGGENHSLVCPLLGRHSVYSALAGAAVAFTQGLDWSQVTAGLEGLDYKGRLIPKEGLNGSIILDDTYNASPLSTLAALDFLEEMEGRKIAVLGDMFELGLYEEEGHRVVGQRAAQVAHKLIVVGPRAQTIGLVARDGGLDDVVVAQTNQTATEALLKTLGSGDYVLVKGSRGMAMEEIVNAVTKVKV